MDIRMEVGHHHFYTKSVNDGDGDGNETHYW